MTFNICEFLSKYFLQIELGILAFILLTWAIGIYNMNKLNYGGAYTAVGFEGVFIAIMIAAILSAWFYCKMKFSI
jgi:hypothetical protein